MAESVTQMMARLMMIGTVGMEMVAPIGIGAAVDYWTGWWPLFLIIGAVLGLVVGIVHLVVLNQPRNWPGFLGPRFLRDTFRTPLAFVLNRHVFPDRPVGGSGPTIWFATTTVSVSLSRTVTGASV